MLTVPSNFAPFQNRLDARYTTIVKIDKGATQYYFSDMEIDWDSGFHVYPLLISHTGINHKIDIVSKKWAISELSITLANTPYRKDTSGNWVRPSYDLGGTVNDTVTVYLLCGEIATGLSDCITKFVGVIQQTPEYDETKIIIRIVDNSADLNMVVPQNLVSDVFSDAPTKHRDARIPLAYGSFDADNATSVDTAKSLKDTLGLAKGLPISQDMPPDCVFADHPIKSWNILYAQMSIVDIPARFVGSGGPALNTNDAGRATSRDFDINPVVWIRFVPTNYTWTPYDFSSQAQVQTPENAYDYDELTSASIRDNVSDNGTTVVGEGRWGFANDKGIASVALQLGANASSGDVIRLKIQIRANLASGVSSTTKAYVFIYYDHDNTGDYRWEPIDTSTNELTGLDGSNQWWDIQFDDFQFDIKDNKNDDCPFLLSVKVTNSVDANGTVNDKTLLAVDEIYLLFAGPMRTQEPLWGYLQGRMFGSWIDNGGRSNSYNQNDLIEDPAFIIESLLRDELGLATANIDEGSFDDSANSSVKARINIIKPITLSKIIRQLSEQSTFAFFYSATDKAKLIPLNESSPTTDRTIPFSHIKTGRVEVSVSPAKVNELLIESRYHPQTGEYIDKEVASNSTSKSIYGTKPYAVKWQNIAGTSKSHVRDFLIGSSGLTLLTFEKIMIEFETVGFTNADLEIGDWIEIDDESMDPQLKRYATSWAGHQFLVIELSQKQDGTRIKAIEL